MDIQSPFFWMAFAVIALGIGFVFIDTKRRGRARTEADRAATRENWNKEEIK